MRLAIFLTYLFILPTFIANTQDWVLAKKANGISVFTRDNPNSNFNAFKAEMDVKTSVDKVEYILKNLDRYKYILPDTEELKILKRINENKHIQYSLTNAPWPVSDRDGVFEMTFTTDPITGAMTSSARAIPDYLPEKDGVVRIRKSRSSWKVIPVDGGQVHIIYEVEAEPGGNIPEWLANSAASELPYETFKNLREELLK